MTSVGTCLLLAPSIVNSANSLNIPGVHYPHHQHPQMGEHLKLNDEGPTGCSSCSNRGISMSLVQSWSNYTDQKSKPSFVKDCFCAASTCSKDKLQRVVLSADWVIGSQLASMKELHDTRAKKRTGKIASRSAHPDNHLFHKPVSKAFLWETIQVLEGPDHPSLRQASAHGLSLYSPPLRVI